MGNGTRVIRKVPFERKSNEPVHSLVTLHSRFSTYERQQYQLHSVNLSNAGLQRNRYRQHQRTSATDTLAKDLATLLKSLSSGDVKEAKTALAKVEADLKANSSSDSTGSSTSTTSGTSSTQSSNPLDKLMNQLSTALNSGDTSSALSDLTTFLVSNGQISGSIVNVNA